MRRHSKPSMAMPHATRSPHYPALPAPPAGIRHPLFVAFVALLIALFTLTPTAQAHDEGMGTHPAIGAWSIDAEPENPDNAPEYTVLGSDGSVINVNPEGGPAIGSWSASGDRTADLTMLAPMVDPEAGFLGMLTIRASVGVADDGQTFSGNYTLEFPAGPEGMLPPPGEYGPAEVTGRRIAVELMGEPVGPWPLAPPEQE